MTTQTLYGGFIRNFLGHAPDWYKKTIIGFLLINPLLLLISPTLVGWCLIVEFIFTLAMALRCYPLQPGGLLAIQAIILGLTDTHHVLQEIEHTLDVILLLMFMVAGIYFMKSMLLFVFTKVLMKVRSKIFLSFLFSFLAAFLSAFLDALTVTAVLIAVSVGFYSVYHKVASGKNFDSEHDHGEDGSIKTDRREELEQFRAFLRSLMMHGAVGTALGGVCTTVGEPQNILISTRVGWDFIEFFTMMAPVTMPVLGFGLLTCVMLEKFKVFGYGAELPETVREILSDFEKNESAKRTNTEVAALIVQAIVAVLLVIGLAQHWATPGIIGLMVIILCTAFNGVIEEHQIGKAFEEALPFTALLVVFFAIVAVIKDQHLFEPVINAVLALDERIQPGVFFMANGLLSAISDNVFVATVYIDSVTAQFEAGAFDREQFNLLAVAINAGTNLPSVATPNGQAAFLFLLTSALAPLIRLSYGKMVLMALPYTVVLTIVGFLGVYFY
ncbi:MAG: sodium/proton antiporter NhaB [Pseudohongiellaceae bacterium]